jgi:hypothetical protein
LTFECQMSQELQVRAVLTSDITMPQLYSSG